MRWYYVLLISWVLVACVEDDPTAQRLMQPVTNQPDAIESFGVSYLFSDSAQVSVELKAGHVLELQEVKVKEGEEPPTERAKRNAPTVHYLNQGVEVFFLNAAGRPHTVITCDSATFRRDEGLAKLTGNVFLRNSDDEQMETEVLYWDRNVDSVYTDQRVRIQTPDKVIIGREGFRSDTKFSGYTIYGIEGELESIDDP